MKARFLLAMTFLLFMPVAEALCADSATKGQAAKPAEPGKAEPQKTQKAGQSGKPEENAGANVKMEAVEIRGEFENPDVFYIIPRRKAEMDTGSLSMDYSGDIMSPVIPHVFEAQHSKEGQKTPAGN